MPANPDSRALGYLLGESMTSFSQQKPAQQRVVRLQYLRGSLGAAQELPVACHTGVYAGEPYDFHSHANNARRVLSNWYAVPGFTVTARPALNGIGHPGFHLTCTRRPDGTWGRTFSNGIPLAVQQALSQLADEIILDLIETEDDAAAAFKKDFDDKKDDEDKGKRQLLRMGLKVPGQTTVQ
jgi:hypothetical protein